MTQYTINTTVREEVVVTKIVDKANADGRAADPTYVNLTNQEYVLARFGDVIKSYVAQDLTAEKESIDEAYGNADDATRNKVKDDLGL